MKKDYFFRILLVCLIVLCAIGPISITSKRAAVQTKTTEISQPEEWQEWTLKEQAEFDPKTQKWVQIPDHDEMIMFDENKQIWLKYDSEKHLWVKI